MVENSPLPEIVERADVARLIPVAADSAKEQRAVSVLLATMTAVDEFARAILGKCGAPTGKTARINCYTEVTFKSPPDTPKFRPDGLIIVSQGSRKWTALVEAKVSRTLLESAQVETYLDLAKAAGFDALITISNQYAGADGGHPVAVDGRKIRSVELRHLSWISIVADAILLSDHEGIGDTEQAFLLREMIRFYKHESSGVVGFNQMGPKWKDLCFSIQQGVAPPKESPIVRESVTDWLELSRYLEVPLSLAIGHSVHVHMTREQINAPSKKVDETVNTLISDGQLSAEFVVPDAASRLCLMADVKRRVLSASMYLKAPTDRARASALVTWLVRQTEKCIDPQILIRAKWPGRAPDSIATLEQIRADKNSILLPNSDALPTAFEVIRNIDLGAKFKSTKAFVEAAEEAVVGFYADVGQHLEAWVPPPPKVREGVSSSTGDHSETPKPAAAMHPVETSTNGRTTPASQGNDAMPSLESTPNHVTDGSVE